MQAEAKCGLNHGEILYTGNDFMLPEALTIG